MQHSRLSILGVILTLSITNHLRADSPDFEWVAAGGGGKNDKTRAVAFDREGNVFMAGESTDDGTFGEWKRKGLGGMDFFLAKVSKEGRFLWVRSLGGGLVDRGYGVATDATGNAYVTGHYQSTDAKAGGVVLPNRGDFDIFVAKYSPSGDLLWIRTAGGSGYDFGHGIAVDQKGDVVVTGAVAGRGEFDGKVINEAGTGRPVFCAKYSPEGDLRWVTGSSGGFSGSGHGIGVDAAGNIFLGGNGSGTGQFGSLTLSSKGASALILKLDPSGRAIWSSLMPGTPSALYHEIAVDDEGRLWCAGMFKGGVTLGDQSWQSTGEKDSDGFLAHFSADGKLRWSRAIQGPATDYCLGVATDGKGRSFVTGEFSELATFAGQSLKSRGATDIYTAAFTPTGELEWVITSGGEKGDNAYTMARHPDGRMVISGACIAPAEFGGQAMASPGGPEAYGALLASPPQPLRADLQRLENEMKSLRTSATPDRFADVDQFRKAVEWALRYDTTLSSKDVSQLERSVARGLERARLAKDGQAPWAGKKGKTIRGFVSQIDGSTQPYGLVIPEHYDGSRPMRLDVVLHGSSKPVGMSEARFVARFDEGDVGGDKPGPATDYIELHPLGRVENCYRWAGETDVFEAIEATCRNYRIDRDRIVLRGMSMGASGTWHLGLKHPDRFVAIGPYCGYVDTHRFSETPIPNFIKVGPLPAHQELGLHMLDSVDYAANAGVVPAIAAIGDKDIFFQAHVIMGEAFTREGLELTNLISPGTGHVIDPVTHAEQMRRIAGCAERGLNRDPKELRYVTWTLKYARCHWLELLGLGKHYERAEFRAAVSGDEAVEVTMARNITRFALHRPVSRVQIMGQAVAIPKQSADAALVFSATAGRWQCEGTLEQATLTGKRPGLQGPIDDAFAQPFLCVRGTGNPWNSGVQAWADASLRRFEYEWARYMRGTLPVKDDNEVTEADVREKHLILFGDPGSNPWITRVLPSLPVSWTAKEVRLAEVKTTAANHAPVLIAPNPLTTGRYVVINSGHSFHEKEFAAFNYLLFPRLGDWAILKITGDARSWQPESTTFPEEVVRAGYFDEAWRGTADAGENRKLETPTR
jgi:pimeloyl-ACP methyl ester carboxylesterase